MASINASNHKLKNGYIAIISSIILSMFLLSLVISQSIYSFSARNNTLMLEYNAIRTELALACVRVAFVHITYDETYNPSESTHIGTNTCIIENIKYENTKAIITSSASYQKSTTTIVVTLDLQTHTIVSWYQI